MTYIIAEVNLNDKQKKQIIKAITSQVPTKLRLTKAQIGADGNELLALTATQIKQIVKAHETSKGATLNLSKAQLDHHRKQKLLTKLITGEGFFSDVWKVAKKVGNVIADKVIIPAGQEALKLARKAGGDKLGALATGACSSLATGALAEQPEFIPMAVGACGELGNLVKKEVSGEGCCGGCDNVAVVKRGRGRPKKSKN